MDIIELFLALEKTTSLARLCREKGPLQELSNDPIIQESFHGLIEASMNVLPAGKRCSRCNGSGLEPQTT